MNSQLIVKIEPTKGGAAPFWAIWVEQAGGGQYWRQCAEPIAGVSLYSDGHVMPFDVAEKFANSEFRRHRSQPIDGEGGKIQGYVSQVVIIVNRLPYIKFEAYY